MTDGVVESTREVLQFTMNLRATLDPETTALIVVDMQRIFIERDGELAKRGMDVSMQEAVVPEVEELLAFARDAGLIVAFTRSFRRADGKDAPQHVYDILPEIYRDVPPFCTEGSEGVEYVDGITPHDGEYEVTKIRYNAFNGTPLERYLRGDGIDTVLICGVTTDVCVMGTARGAYERGFNVVLVGDCCASSSREQHDATLENAEAILGTVATRFEVERALSGVETAEP